MDTATHPSSGTAARSRAELARVLQDYLSALTARDPSRLRLASNLRSTENAEPIALGDGLWRSAERIREGTRVDFIDPVTGQAGSQMVIEERDGTAVIFQVRLKLADDQISEVETIAVRGDDLEYFDAAGMLPVPTFLQRVPPEKRTSRARMIDTVERYVELLKVGSCKQCGTRIHPEMVRWENGVVTSDYAELSTRENGPKRAAIPTRIPIIDEEYGLVYALLEFGLAERVLCPFELFKIEGDQIMMLHIVIGVMRSGVWGRAEPLPAAVQ